MYRDDDSYTPRSRDLMHRSWREHQRKCAHTSSYKIKYYVIVRARAREEEKKTNVAPSGFGGVGDNSCIILCSSLFLLAHTYNDKNNISKTQTHNIKRVLPTRTTSSCTESAPPNPPDTLATTQTLPPLQQLFSSPLDGTLHHLRVRDNIVDIRNSIIT